MSIVGATFQGQQQFAGRSYYATKSIANTGNLVIDPLRLAAKDQWLFSHYEPDNKVEPEQSEEEPEPEEVEEEVNDEGTEGKVYMSRYSFIDNLYKIYSLIHYFVAQCCCNVVAVLLQCCAVNSKATRAASPKCDATSRQKFLSEY